jgi:hypothetical protein
MNELDRLNYSYQEFLFYEMPKTLKRYLNF